MRVGGVGGKVPAFPPWRVACTVLITGMRRITTFRSTKDRIYDGGPKRL